MADEIGGNNDAFQKAAELAGISGYDYVDVNYEVLKQYIRDLNDIFSFGDQEGGWPSAQMLMGPDQNADGLDPSEAQAGANASQDQMEALRGLMLYGRMGIQEEDPLPEFPVELNHPNFYYLYVGNAP